jgi:hypothetical protein
MAWFGNLKFKIKSLGIKIKSTPFTPLFTRMAKRGGRGGRQAGKRAYDALEYESDTDVVVPADKRRVIKSTFGTRGAAAKVVESSVVAPPPTSSAAVDKSISPVVRKSPPLPAVGKSIQLPVAGGGGQSFSNSRASFSNSPAQPPKSVVISSSGGCRPFDASLISSFGGFDHMTIGVVEDFFITTMEDGDEDLTRGLLIMSQGMAGAIEKYLVVCNDLRTTSGRLAHLFHEKGERENMLNQLHGENNQLKVRCLLSFESRSTD